MKKHLFKAFAFMGIAAVFCACNKDNSTVSPEPPGTINDPIEQLRGFRAQVKAIQAHPDVKNSELMALDDALWDVENLFNLTFSETEQYYVQTNSHEFSLYLPVTEDDNVTVSDAVDLYSQVVEAARNALISDTFEDKGFISLNIQQTETANGMVRVDFSGKTGARSDHHPPVAHVDGPFGEDDNWMFACGLGKCDDPDIPSGADKQLQEKLYIELIEPYISADLGYRNVYINRKNILFDGSNYNLLFFRTDPNDMCIDHWSMNEYYSGEKRTLSYFIPEQYHLTGYQLISIVIDGGPITSPMGITHFNAAEYGERVQVRIDEFGNVENLLIP